MLGIYLRCYGALMRPDAQFKQILASLVHDRPLAQLCKTAINYTPVSSATKAAGCQSLHHSRQDNKAKLDLRSRSPRCTQCFNIEDNIRKASWPLISSLGNRLDPKTHDAVVQSVKTLTRTAIFELLGRTHHDLQLAKIPKIERIGHWLYKVTPHAEAVCGFRRSKYSSELLPLVDDIARHGWAKAPKMRLKTSYGATVKVVKSIIALNPFLDCAKLLNCVIITLHLTAPQQTHDSVGPLERFSLGELAEALSSGATQFHGCRAPPSSAALELVATFGVLGNNVVCANLGPEHAYLGSDKTVRQHLANEEKDKWAGLRVAAELAEFVQCLRAGSNGQSCVPNVLPNAGRKRKKSGQEAAADGEKSPKRATLTATKTI